MKINRIRGVLILVILMLGLGEHAVAENKPKAKYQASFYEWLDTPWKVRYLIRISRNMPWRLRADQYFDEDKALTGNPEFHHYVPWFSPIYLPPLKEEEKAVLAQGKHWLKTSEGKHDDLDARLGYVVIEFDRDGKVLSPHNRKQHLVGKTGDGYDSSTGEHYREIYLVEGDAKPGQNWSLVAKWFEGFRSGAGSEVSPALCGYSLEDDRYRAQANPLRAEKYDMVKVEDKIGLTGCREWAWQRNRGVKVQPYIDVSSYPSKKLIKETQDDSPFIAEVLGWGGFDEPPRPIIGMYDGKWFCLHDCPDGEAPGVIDIKQWTAQRGWPNIPII